MQRVLVTMQDDGGTATTDSMSTPLPAPGRRLFGGMFGGAIPTPAARFFRAWLFFIFMQMVLSGLVGRGSGGPFSAVWRSLDGILPATVTALAPAFPLTWPLMLAQTLVTPVPFFAFALPPIVLLAPLWLGLNHQRLMSVAASVSNAETFWITSRARTKRTIGALLWIIVIWLVFGYGWRSLIIDGDLCALLPGTTPGVNWALAAAWTLAIVAGTFFSGMALEAPLTRRAEGRLEQAAALASWRAVARIIIARLGAATGIYFVFCWLGGLSGVSNAWMGRLPLTLITAAAFLLADFGSGALQSALTGSPRMLCRVVRCLWFFGLAGEAVIRVLRGWVTGHPFSFDQAPHVLFSPFVTLFALFRQPAWQPEVQLALLVQAILGSISFILAVALVMKTAPAAEGAAQGRSIIDLILAPFLALYRLWQAFWAVLWRIFEYIKRALSQCEEAIIRWGARYDNPVLTAHLRWKVHKEHWPAQWLGALALGGTLLLIFGGMPLLYFILDKINGAATGGTTFASFIEGWGTIVVYVVLGMGALLSLIAGMDMGMAFDRDRASGSLVFLFLTPLTDKAIVGGKLIVGFIDVLCLLATGLPWLLIGCFAGVIGGYLALPVVCVVGIVAIISLLAFAVCLHTLFAVRAIKPGEGSAKAFLSAIVIEIGTWFLVSYLMDFSNRLAPSLTLESSTAMVCMTLLMLTLIHLSLAYVCWQLALLSLRRIRYGDVTVGGKTTG